MTRSGVQRLGSPARRAFRPALLVGTITGIALALRAASSNAGSVSWPSAGAVAVAFVLSASALTFGMLSWTALFPGTPGRHVLGRGFFFAQLGKYVPGGVVQIARLYESARRVGIEKRVVAVSLPVQALCGTVAPGAAAAVALGLVADHLHAVARLALLVGGAVGLVLTLRRKLVSWLLDSLHRRWSRIPPSTALPSQSAIMRSFALGLMASMCFGAQFVLLVGVSSDVGLVAALGFLVAFTVGFLALPFPSGLGVREALLIALLVDVAPVADLLPAAVALRIVQIGAELALATGSAILATVGAVRRRPSGSGFDSERIQLPDSAE